MPFASYSELAAYAEANFPTAFRALPDPNTYAIVKSSPLGPRVKIGYSSVDSQSAVWALLWSCHGQITYIDGDGWIPVGSFTLEEPYSQLWDGEAQQNALGHPDVFDAFIRYSIMAMGQPGYLQVSNNPLRYHFQPVFRELCEGWPKASLADGDNGEENTATVDHPDMLVSSVKLHHLLSEIERLTLQSKTSQVLLEVFEHAHRRKHGQHRRRAAKTKRQIKGLQYKLLFANWAAQGWMIKYARLKEDVRKLSGEN